jgi:hypothetical protein
MVFFVATIYLFLYGSCFNIFLYDTSTHFSEQIRKKL